MQAHPQDELSSAWVERWLGAMPGAASLSAHFVEAA
jgi:hypothetical protein